MNGNKFQVGELVGVYCMQPLLMIPKTVVREVRFVPVGSIVMNATGIPGVIGRELYAYLIDGYDIHIPEMFLRPILPDDEIVETEVAEDVQA